MHFETRKNRILFYGVLLSLGSIFIRGYSLNAFSIVDDEPQDWKSNCEYTLKDGIYTIDSICVSEKFLPNMTLSEIVNNAWNQISDFSEYYQPFEESFNYHGAIPSFKTKGSPYLQENANSDRLISDAIKSRKKISFSETELAQYYAKHLSYFVADKDLAKLGNCTHRNYSLALESLDNYVLKPGDTLNINQKLSTIQNYCRGQTKQYHLFYGGVCGMVSQLFRVSLQNPNIAVIERSPHNERFVQYYGETIGGDDASVYERSKQFEIENVGESDIIFKIREEGNYSILVAISQPTNKWVNISKSLINEKESAIHLEKTIYKYSENLSNNIDNIERVESFDSYYARKTYEIR